MFLLDTDTLSLLFQGHPKVVVSARSVDDDVGTTIITKIEILRARHDFVLKGAMGSKCFVPSAGLFKAKRLCLTSRPYRSTRPPRPNSIDCAEFAN